MKERARCTRDWPDGKKFVIVLTHDVEGSKGLSRAERLKKKGSIPLMPSTKLRRTAVVREIEGLHGWEFDTRPIEPED